MVRCLLRFVTAGFVLLAISIIDPANVPSQRIATKIGLRPEKHTTVFGLDRVIYAATFC